MRCNYFHDKRESCIEKRYLTRINVLKLKEIISSKPAAVLYDYFLSQIRQVHTPIASGIFGADMQVSLTNDGPVTFFLEC
jgi:hypothetical protein